LSPKPDDGDRYGRKSSHEEDRADLETSALLSADIYGGLLDIAWTVLGKPEAVREIDVSKTAYAKEPEEDGERRLSPRKVGRKPCHQI
jgi:hypothetical protein